MAYSRKISDRQFFSGGCDMALRRSTTQPPSSPFLCRSSAPVLLPNCFSTTKKTTASFQSNRPSSLSCGGSRATTSATLNQKRTTSCDCSTQNHHPLAYRCPLHRRKSIPQTTAAAAPNRSKSTRLNCRRSAMANSLVRLGVERELVKISLSKMVRPSSNVDELLLRRRGDFHRMPSRLSAITKADDDPRELFFVDDLLIRGF